jgi:hypothetical protein
MENCHQKTSKKLKILKNRIFAKKTKSRYSKIKVNISWIKYNNVNQIRKEVTVSNKNYKNNNLLILSKSSQLFKDYCVFIVLI